MALISIPTSIGGITIPGLNKGPLSSLFGNSYNTKAFQYPSDLGSANKNHFVRFEIREIESAEFTDPTEGKGFSIEGFKNIGKNTADKFEKIYNTVTDASTSFAQNLTPKYKTLPSATIQLYMPDSLDFQSSVGYGQTDILNAGLDLLGKVGTAASATLKNSAVQLGLKNFGYAINPQIQLLFEGIDFRDYSFSFVFSPNSKEESDTIKNIIKNIRAFAAPQIIPDTKGMFYRPPAVFDVSFWSNGTENTKINKIKTSVVKSIDVNYAPNGWAAHSNGAPVQTTLTIQLQETILVDRNEILAGY